MRKWNQRLPAWLAGITALVATAGVAAQEPNATRETGAAALAGIKDCTAASGATIGRCDETQSGQTAHDERESAETTQSTRDEDAQAQMSQRGDDERNETRKGFDEGDSAIAQESGSSDGTQTGSGSVAGHSPDETAQTRVVPPAYATPAPSSMTEAAANASAAQAGQDSDATGTSANDARSSDWQDRAPQDVARAQESIDSEHMPAKDAADSEQDYANRADSTASEQDEPSTRSVPPEHATRMPETNTSSSSSATAANDRDSDTSRSDAEDNDVDEPSRSANYASDRQEREAIGAGSATGIAGVQSRFDALDTDHDGTIDAAEASVSTTLRAQFFTLDADGDGKISVSEFKGASDIASIRADRRERRQ